MKKIFFLLGKIYSFICPQVLINKWMAIKIFFFTGYKSIRFCSIGENTTLGIHTIYIGEKYISLGTNTSIGDYGRLTAYPFYEKTNQHFTPEIVIGNNCSIGAHFHITAINKVKIGNNVLTGPRILITDNAHGGSSKDLLTIAPSNRPMYSKGEVVIEDNVWIGEGAMIMSNVHVGKGAIIACNSVVTTDIPPYSIVAGSPAKIVKNFN